MPTAHKNRQHKFRRGTDWVLRLDFRQGLNQGVNPEVIGDNELQDVDNYVPDRKGSGSLRVRTGVTQHGSVTTAGAVTSIFQGTNANYFTEDTVITTFDGTDRDTGLSSATYCDWATHEGQGMDVYVDGVNNPRKTTNGTTFADLGGTPPAFTVITAYKRMLFGSGHGGGSIRFSNIDDPDTWDASDELLLDKPVTALFPYRGVLLAFFQDGFVHIQGSSRYDLSSNFANEEEGCPAHQSIVATPYGLFWWSNAGIVQSDGVNVRYVSEKQMPNGRTVDRLTKVYDGLNKAQNELVHAVWNPTERRVEFFVFNGVSTTVNLKIMYYPIEDSFWLASGAGIQMGASALVVDSDEDKIFVGSAAAGKLFTQSGFSDDGTAITATLDTKEFEIEDPVGVKKLDTTNLNVKSSDIGLQWDLRALKTSAPPEVTNSYTTAAAAEEGFEEAYGENFNRVKFGIDITNTSATGENTIQVLTVKGTRSTR